MPPKKKGGKKNDDWDDDLAEKRIAALTKGVQGKKQEETVFSSEDDEPAPAPKPKAKKMAAFLMMEDEEDEQPERSESEKEEEDEKPEPEPEPQPQKQKGKEKPEKKAPAKDNKKKKGKKGAEKADEEDLDAILAELKIEAPPAKEEEPKKETKAKEASPKQAEAGDEEKKDEVAKEDNTPDGGDGEGKKKKKKKRKGGDKEGDENKEETPQPEGEEEGESDGEEGDGEKKKKKKKKKDKEKKKEEGKPKKKNIEMLKELLRAREEEEKERLAEIEAEKIRIAEMEKARLERERIEKEEEEKRKAEEDKLRKAGKLLTPEQIARYEQARARLLAQGIDPDKIKKPTAGEPGEKRPGGIRPVVYQKKKKGGQQQQRQNQQKKQEQEAKETKEEEKTPSPEPEPEVKEQEPSPVVAVEEPAEILDDWEMAEVVEKKPDPVPEPVVAQAPKAKAASKQESPVHAAQKTVVAKDAVKVEELSSEESSSEDSSEESSSEEESGEEEAAEVRTRETKEQRMQKVKARLQKRKEAADANRSTDNLRAPVICVLGHVDTGKTKMLDTIRRTKVQDGEAGGITQQIGATQVPGDAIKERCKNVHKFDGSALKIPGFLIIDTPGHESFANLRSRGSSLCDYAILVVDIMHGLEPQTIESLKLLLKRKTPFVVALNKIDRLYNYESNPRKDVYAHLNTQPQNTKLEFKERYQKIVVEFAEQGVNVALSTEMGKKSSEDFVFMVPTSAYMGDGIGNVMAFIAQTCQTKYAEKLSFSEDLDCTVMEVKSIPGLGTTIDVILVNGTLKVGNVIVLTGSDGAIVTQVRDLLMPQPLKEMRVKNEYVRYSSIKGAQGVKLLAKNLDKTLAGLPMFVADKEDEIEYFMAECESGLEKALTSIKKKPEGVYVQASTLGSLEALLEFLKTQKIPYSNVNIGPVHRRDVQKAAAMLAHKAEYACILAFDVKIEKDAQQFADAEGVKIFQADIIYHLEDNFLKYREELKEQARKENEHLAIFPCKIRVLPQHIFNARNPIVCGVSIEAGQLKKGAPLCVPSKECIMLGHVSSIERNHEEVNLAKAGEEVCIKIENTTGEAPKLYGRHFTHEDILVSRITRESIDICKAYFRDDLTKADWQLIVALKKQLDIM